MLATEKNDVLNNTREDNLRLYTEPNLRLYTEPRKKRPLLFYCAAIG